MRAELRTWLFNPAGEPTLASWVALSKSKNASYALPDADVHQRDADARLGEASRHAPLRRA